MTELATLSLARLKAMSKAATTTLDALRAMGKAGTNPVAQVLAHQGKFYEMKHYPKGDVYDGETGAQYYYHAHRVETGEHGHFHVFMRAKGIPHAVKPARCEGTAAQPAGDNAVCHLIGISMDRAGLPVGLLTTNRWVTGETFYSARDVIRLLGRFSVDHVHPCLATNRWITAMVTLFRPQIETLLRERDAATAAWTAAHPGRDVLEDENLEITSQMIVDIDTQIASIDQALQLRRAAR